MKKLMICLLACILLLGGCGTEEQNTGGETMPGKVYTQIDQEKAKEMMQQEGSIIVDVRRQDEYEEGHIPGAICIPNESIGTEMPAELPDLEQVILIYCRSGNRSKQASQKLADIGYTNVYEFGGIIDWTGDVVTGKDPYASGTEETTAGTTEGTTLVFPSFDGGGPGYTIVLEDPDLVTFTEEHDYGQVDHDMQEGSPYDVIFTFTGVKPGTTKMTVEARSPITESRDFHYTVTVEEDLHVTLEEIRQITMFKVYWNGSAEYDYYEIGAVDDGYEVAVSGGVPVPIDEESVNALAKVIGEYDVQSWDGFHEYSTEVVDGEGFTLEVAFADGATITATGINKFPDNYKEVMERFREILGKVRR